MASTLAMLYWQRKKRKTRKPFGDDFKLLRGPGESQLKVYLQQGENDLFWIMGAAMAPVVMVMAGGYFTTLLPGRLKLAGLALSALALIVSFLLAARFLARRTQHGWDRYLGYFGERIVAEHLEPLKAQGWRIVHDLPGTANGHKFNLDHVAIGPQGVFVIETKTWRKRKGLPGSEDHKVFFNGRTLEWPWGEDNRPLEQAERNAIWLADTIKSDTDERVHVSPILTLPGWWVENKPARDARMAKVTNPKALPKFLSAGAPVLNDTQINAIATKLEARCRDVGY